MGEGWGKFSRKRLVASWIKFVIFYLAAAFWHEDGCAGVGLLGISRMVTAMKAVLLGIATEFLGEEIYPL